MPICPFIKGDLQTGNIKFMVYNSNMDKSLIEIIREWDDSQFKTGLILHIGDDMETIVRKPYQKFLNEELKKIKWVMLNYYVSLHMKISTYQV